MPAELVAGAAPAGEALPPGTALILTDMILGLPWYYWGFVLAGLIIMLLLGAFAYYYVTMAPVGQYFWAAWKNSDLLVFLRLSGKMTLRSAKYLTGIFNDKEYPLSWIQRSDSSFRLGKCSAKIVCDTTGIASEPELNMAIKTWVAEWNDKELRKQAEAYYRGEEYMPDLVTDYYDLYQKIKSGQVDDPVVIPAVFEVPLWEIERYLPEIGPGDLEGHVSTRIEEDKVEEEKKNSTIPGWLWFFIAIEVCIIAPVALLMFIKG